jgi:hypothetical protein
MTGSEDKREFRLGWSLFRRAHQAVAERCHKAKHAAKRDSPPEVPTESDGVGEAAAATAALPQRGSAVLTDAEWERVSPLLGAQKPPRGRPRRDHRQVLSGMLWIMESGASWRDLPEEQFGPWRTVYGRYRQWLGEGLWSRIVRVLGR